MMPPQFFKKKKVRMDLVYGRKYSCAFVVLAFFEEVVD